MVLTTSFINVGPNLARKIKGHPEKTFAEFMNNRNSSCMFLKPIIESEVTKVLKSCKNKFQTSETSE